LDAVDVFTESRLIRQVVEARMAALMNFEGAVELESEGTHRRPKPFECRLVHCREFADPEEIHELLDEGAQLVVTRPTDRVTDPIALATRLRLDARNREGVGEFPVGGSSTAPPEVGEGLPQACALGGRRHHQRMIVARSVAVADPARSLAPLRVGQFRPSRR
jgi:hypothetical protein